MSSARLPSRTAASSLRSSRRARSGRNRPKLVSPAHHVALLSCATAIKNANQPAWTQARLACADIGIDPGSPAFGQCVFDLYYSLWSEQNVYEN